MSCARRCLDQFQRRCFVILYPERPDRRLPIYRRENRFLERGVIGISRSHFIVVRRASSLEANNLIRRACRNCD